MEIRLMPKLIQRNRSKVDVVLVQIKHCSDGAKLYTNPRIVAGVLFLWLTSFILFAVLADEGNHPD